MSFAELCIKSGPSGKKYGDSVNFLDPFRAGYVVGVFSQVQPGRLIILPFLQSLPEETKYWPPIVVKHLDCSNKKETAIGAAMFAHTEKFLKKPITPSDGQTVVEANNIQRNRTEQLAKPPIINKFYKFWNFPKIKVRRRSTSVSKGSKQQIAENKFTWYTKFYNSMNCDDKGGIEKHRLRVFDCELEKVDEYSCLTDWAEPMNLIKGTNSKKLSGPKDSIYGMLKCNICVTKTSDGDNNDAVVDVRGNRQANSSKKNPFWKYVHTVEFQSCGVVKSDNGNQNCGPNLCGSRNKFKIKRRVWQLRSIFEVSLDFKEVNAKSLHKIFRYNIEDRIRSEQSK